MTTKRKGTKRGSFPGMIGRSARKMGLVQDGIPAIRTEMVPAAPDRTADPERERRTLLLIRKLTGDAPVKAKKLRFLEMLSPGPEQRTLGQAWKVLHPSVKTKSCYESGSRFYRQILDDIGDDGALSLMGVNLDGIGKTLADASKANFVREFVCRDGTIVTGKERPDFLVRLRSAELQMKLLGLGREKDLNAGPVVINVVSYCGPNAVPWPNGGRALPDGRFVDTVGPNSPAALHAARPDPVSGN